MVAVVLHQPARVRSGFHRDGRGLEARDMIHQRLHLPLSLRLHHVHALVLVRHMRIEVVIGEVEAPHKEHLGPRTGNEDIVRIGDLLGS